MEKTDRKFDLIIENGKAEKQYWSDLWHFRELLFFLSWRDILVRYKQAVIGVAWSVIRPFFTMVAFVLVFNKVAKLETRSVPYALSVFSALLPWQLFSTSLGEASNSLITNSNLVSKVYFPRMIIPLSSILVCLIDFFISLLILFILMIFYHYKPSLNILFLPFFVLLVIIASTGLGLWLSALNVKYRDFRYVVPFIIQFGLYISPVGFSTGIVPEEWRFIYSINPMVGIIDGFRWCILGGDNNIYWPGFCVSLGLVVFLLLIGITYFRSTEKSFVDKI